MNTQKNGTGTPKVKAELENQANGKAGEKPQAPAAVEPAKEATAQEVARQRLDKRNKLNALYDDIEKLSAARQSFDGISSFGDLTIAVKAGNEITFVTSRTDTVQDALKAIEASIDRKLADAYKQLAEFTF